MKKAYRDDDQQHTCVGVGDEEGTVSPTSFDDGGLVGEGESLRSFQLTDIDFDDESWDDEGQMLFEWTKNLSYEPQDVSSCG